MAGRSASRLFAGALMGLLLVLPTSAALAHGDIQSMRPAEGDTRARPPRHIQITFTEAPTEDSVIDVTDGCGRDVVREQSVEGRTKHVFTRARRAVPGEWEVSFRVISAEDGHLTRGSYNFTVEGETDCSEPDPEPDPEDPEDPEDPGDGSAAPGDGDDDGGDFPLVPVAIGGGAIIGLAALVRIFSTRGGGP